jgi:heme/copper-type cytochrome/quinol oxidase subunit 2
MLNLLSLFNPVLYDAPEPWQIGFQDGASPTFEGIIELHNSIFFYLVVISVGVSWVMGSVLVNFNNNTSPIIHKYTNHGTLIELVWTITPAFILIAIAFPSFKLLYLIDEVISPSMTIKVVGHQWYWTSDLIYSDTLDDLSYSTLAMILKKAKATPISRIPRSTNTALVTQGTTGSTVGLGSSVYMRNSTFLSLALISQLIGHLLGDGTLQFSDSRASKTPWFIFVQTIKRFRIPLECLWTSLTQMPYLYNSVRKGVPVPFMQVITRTYPFLLTLHQLFYVKKANGKYTKVITWKLYSYLNEVVLAYWAILKTARGMSLVLN